jgi:hypothetical protein
MWRLRSCINVSGLELERAVLRTIMGISARIRFVGHACAPWLIALAKRGSLEAVSEVTQKVTRQRRHQPTAFDCLSSISEICGGRCRTADRVAPRMSTSLSVAADHHDRASFRGRTGGAVRVLAERYASIAR